MSKVIHLTDDDFNTVTETGVTMVGFMAPWCGPCRLMTPIFSKMAKEYSGKVKVCDLNADIEVHSATRLNIRAIPAIMFYKNGMLVDQITGAVSENVISDKLNFILI